MTSDYHSPHPFRAPLTSTELNRPLGELDAALGTIVLAGSGVTTTLDATAASGQKVIPLTSTTGISAGQSAFVSDGTNFDAVEVASVSAGISVTAVANLVHTYLAGSQFSLSPAEIVLARDGYATLSANLEAKIGALNDKGAGQFGVSGDPNTAMPIVFVGGLNGPEIVAANDGVNALGHYINTQISGDFAGMGGNDPGFLWGSYVWTLTAPDAENITTLYGIESEIGLRGTATDIAHVMAGSFSHGLWEGSGGHIGVLEGLRISPVPGLHGAASWDDWTIDQIFGLYVEGPGSVASSGFAIFTAGGPSRFSGRLDVDTVVTGWNGSVELQAAFSKANGATLFLDGNSVGLSSGNAVVYLSKAGSALVVHTGSTTAATIGRDGKISLPLINTVVTGSRGGNAALASLLTKLAATGLITDSSSA